MASDKSWKKIWDDKDLDKHDFTQSPAIITAKEIKKVVRILQRQLKKKFEFYVNKTNVKTGQKCSKIMGYSFCQKEMVLTT